MGHSPSFRSHDKDIIRYTSCGFHCFDQCVLKVRVRDGAIISVEPDDTINPGIAREGEHLPERLIDTAMIQHRPCPKGYAMAQEIYDPNRVKYPMKRLALLGTGSDLLLQDLYPRAKSEFRLTLVGNSPIIETDTTLERSNSSNQEVFIEEVRQYGDPK